MSEQSKQPATSKKSSDSDSASNGKAAESGKGTPRGTTVRGSGTAESAQGTQGTQATPGPQGTRGAASQASGASGFPLDIPASGESRDTATERNPASARNARKKAVEKGLFDISEETFPEMSDKGRSSANGAKSGNGKRNAKSRAGNTKAETARKSPARPSPKAKTVASSPETAKESAVSGRSGGNKQTGTAKKAVAVEKPTDSGKTGGADKSGNNLKKTGKDTAKTGDRQKVGARITSGGDPTIERKPALTTTTPIRKRKSDGRGGVAVLIALLVVAAAAGYYLLTQTGILGPLRNEQIASTATVESPVGATPANTAADPAGEESAADSAPGQQTEKTETEAPPPAAEAPVSRNEPANTPTGVLTTAGGKKNPSTPPPDAGKVAGPTQGSPDSTAADIPEAPPAPVLPKAAASLDSAAGPAVSSSTGSANAQTSTVLAKSEAGEGLTEQAKAPTVLTDESLREIEELLMRLQIDPGPTDGVIDNRTVTAIRLYQEIAGLPVDGRPSPGLLVELREVVELLSND